MTEEEFRKISNFFTSKEAWDILQVVHERMNTVKNSKIQRLTTEFENIKMSDSESFSDFHDKFKDLCNSLHNLGEPAAETRIVKKILRSLPLFPKLQPLKRENT